LVSAGLNITSPAVEERIRPAEIRRAF